MDGEPGAVAAEDDDAVDAGCEDSGQRAERDVVDDGAVRDAAFGRVQAVRGGDRAQEPERDVGG